MSTQAVARRYAGALFDVVKKNQTMDAAHAALTGLAALVAFDPKRFARVAIVLEDHYWDGTDAAVVFLLAMKRFGVSDPKRIPACTVMWNGQEHREHVLLGA